MIIGLMGRSGSGKTYVQKAVQHLFNDSLDLDQLGHRILLQKDIKIMLKSEFGNTIIVDGEIARDRLREIVFSSKKALAFLNRLCHPRMKKYAEHWAQKIENGLIVGSLIYQIKINKVCNAIISIDATDLEIHKYSPDRKLILDSQPSREWYNSHADLILKNTWNSFFNSYCTEKIEKILRV